MPDDVTITKTIIDPRVESGQWLVSNQQPVQSYIIPVIIGASILFLLAVILDQSDR